MLQRCRIVTSNVSSRNFASALQCWEWDEKIQINVTFQMSKHSILLISWLLCSTWHVNWVRSSLVAWSYQFLEHWTRQWSVESVCTDHWRNSNGSIQSCTQSEHSYNIILLEMTLLRHILHNTQFWSLFSSLVVQSLLILVQTQTLDSGSEEMLGRVEMSRGRLKLPWQRQIFQQRKY